MMSNRSLDIRGNAVVPIGGVKAWWRKSVVTSTAERAGASPRKKLARYFGDRGGGK